jgi:hypothetical protein
MFIITDKERVNRGGRQKMSVLSKKRVKEEIETSHTLGGV